MVGKRVVSDEQQDIFIQFFKANPSCWDTNPCPVAYLRRAEHWTELTTRLNSAKGCRKTLIQWRNNREAGNGASAVTINKAVPMTIPLHVNLFIWKMPEKYPASIKRSHASCQAEGGIFMAKIKRQYSYDADQQFERVTVKYWTNIRYSIRNKANQIAKAQESGKSVGWSTAERKILADIPLEYFLLSSVFNVDRTSDSSQSLLSSTSSILSPEHLKKVPELPVKTLSLSTEKYSSGFVYGPTKTPEELLPVANSDHPAKTSLPPEKYSTIAQSDLPAKRKSLLPGKDSTSFNLSSNIVRLPLQVSIVTADMSRMIFEEIEFIKKIMYEKLWNYMVIPTTNCLPVFESCSILEPFGLIFKCCNEDALEWLTTTIGRSPFIERNLIVSSDTPDKLPTTVDMCVELSSDFELDKETSSIFNVLVHTNKSWLDTAEWMLLEDKCLPPTSDLAYPAKMRLVFSVPLTDVPKIREKEFKLHFLLGVVPVNYYKEFKQEEL